MTSEQKEAELRESLAAVQHEIWSHRMRYQLSCCTLTSDMVYRDGDIHIDVPNVRAVIPADKLERWMLQMQTPYAELTEQEKASDRDQADKVLAVLRGEK